MLIHPEHFVKARVINVAPGDKLELRSGIGRLLTPSQRYRPTARILRVFDHDGNFDGDTWWFPVEWHGFRGYVHVDRPLEVNAESETPDNPGSLLPVRDYLGSVSAGLGGFLQKPNRRTRTRCLGDRN